MQTIQNANSWPSRNQMDREMAFSHRWTHGDLLRVRGATWIWSCLTTGQRSFQISDWIGYHPLNERILSVRLRANPINVTIFQVYAPIAAATEEEIEAFYGEIQNAIDSANLQDVKIIMGDFNAKVGCDVPVKGVTGKHGLGECNERGQRLIDFCIDNKLTITNTMYQHHPRRKYTWISPDGNTLNQIDYILIDNRWKTSIWTLTVSQEQTVAVTISCWLHLSE